MNINLYDKNFKSSMDKALFSSKDPNVDGTALTTNKDIQHVRKRIVGGAKHYTKPSKISEFIALVNWITGTGEPAEQPSMLHLSILNDVRHDRPVKENYRAWVDANYDLVKQAAKLLPKAVKEKYKNYLASKAPKERVETPVSTERNTMSVEDWTKLFNRVLNSKESAPVSFWHASGIKCYQLNGAKGFSSVYSKTLLKALESSKLADFLYVHADRYDSWIRRRTDEECLMTHEELYHNRSAKKQTKVETQENTPVVEDTQPVEVEVKNDELSLDTLSALIKIAKKAGAVEITIKL